MDIMAFTPVERKEVGMVPATPVKDRAQSMLPPGKKWKMVWNDEFDGNELDRSKWDFRLNFWGYRSPTYTDEGVEVSDGSVKIHLVRKGDDFYSAELQTGSLTFDNPPEPDNKNLFWPFGEIKPPKFLHKYGYYEVRCRLPKNDGWHAAFWLQAPGIGSHPDASVCGVECDIMESYRLNTDGNVICGCGWGGYGRNRHWYGHYAFPFEETEDGWHTYGMDWTPEGYYFYADGKFVGSQLAPECAVSNVEEFVLLTTECHGYHRVFNHKGGEGETKNRMGDWGKPVPELFDAYPDCFEVDYVRVFDEIKD